MLSRRVSSDISPNKNPNSVQNKEVSSDENSAPLHRNKKRVQQFSDSDTEKENVQSTRAKNVQNNSDSEPENIFPLKSGLAKSRIQMKDSSSDSDDPKGYGTVKNEEQQMRMKNKRNKLKDKFKGLLSSRGKHTSSQTNGDEKSSEESHGEISDPSDSEMSSIAKIKQKIKKSMASVSSICDPDTSDEEGHMNKRAIPKHRQKKDQKSTKLIEPKPIRMSAKQAMENMQLIKSESNRMLREKAVSLPYHRPKALSLKDIMSRRKPAVSSDGKALPIKMNGEQLKQYALLLEQRQREMMELCKSESDEETNEAEEKDGEPHQEQEKLPDSDNIENDNIIEKSSSSTLQCVENETKIPTDMNDVNDVLYDKLIKNNSVNKGSAEFENTDCDITKNDKEIVPNLTVDSNKQTEDDDKDDSNTDFKLVYNNSVEEENVTVVTEVITGEGIQNDITENGNHLENNSEQQVSKVNSEPESQLVSLHYNENNTEELEQSENANASANENSEQVDFAEAVPQDDFFSDDDVNMDDIDRIIENAEIMKDEDNINSPILVRDPQALNSNPKIMGAPGMVIDLDGGAIEPRKLSGVELLKERFTYFSKLRTPEELERQKEKTLKPGAQHQKLKHELGEKIAEQRSLEWAKRLEEEKQQHMEMETILDDAEDSFEKIEAKLDENDEKEQSSSSESEEEEELEENDVDIKDKPRKNNPMLDDEAEESDYDENDAEAEPMNENKEEIDSGGDNLNEDDEVDESSEEEESSESEEDEKSKTKKSRILKAFEDSDDEDATIIQNETNTTTKDIKEINDVDAVISSNDHQGSSQDDVIQLAQRHKSASDDLFTSQESSTVNDRNKDGNNATQEVLGTQTFSILDSSAGYNLDIELKSPSKISALCMSQPYHDPSINAIVDGSQLPITQSSQSQPIGEDILALCTGKFYDNEFVSQTEEYQHVHGMSQELLINNDFIDNHDKQTEPASGEKLSNKYNAQPVEDNVVTTDKKADADKNKLTEDGNVLKSILDELDDPEFNKPKPNKFFTGGSTKKQENEAPENSQMKKRFIIDSDDDTNETSEKADQGKKKKLKKKKPEKRALQISDDEEEEDQVEQEEDEYLSDLEDDAERLVEYDSEENEIEVKPDKPKTKRKATDFFEQEAELTSEDEWVGSGDEDEKGLDRMEREAGDDEVFHQGKLRRELGQIHMRDVLDQDKREVRIIQELLFEDGDLGGGHRQRKFRWRNAGEDDETGAAVDEFADTQEEEFESEEQWRKQRHEREVFLKQMQQDEEEDIHNVSVNRTTIIKANLSSKSMSMLLEEVNQSKTEKTESPAGQEKKTVKDIPSPKKSFSIFQQNYHGSLLTRGRGALARLAALATPLAVDDDAPKIGSLASHKRNFVFTALTPDDDEPKVTIKRKADVGTPKLVKKMKIEEKMVHPKSSLLDHFNL